MFAEKYERTAGMLRRYTKICQELDSITENFSRIDPIIALEKHSTLMRHFLDSKCVHISTIKTALTHINYKTLLIYITELCLYGVFEIDNYLQFVKTLSGVRNEDGSCIEYTPVQIIFSDSVQKITLMCDSIEYIPKLRRYCLQYFKSDIKTTPRGKKINVIIDKPMMSGLVESQNNVEKFMQYLSDYGETPTELCYPASISRIGEHRYIGCALVSHIDAQTTADVINKLVGGQVIIDHITHNKTIDPIQDIKKARIGYSRVCIEWLNSISMNIRHAERGGEYRIPRTKYRVDGYDSTTNTVYEFHGTYWHGHPDYHNPDDINKVTNCTFGKLYAKTLLKEAKIRELGYNLVVMWEHDYHALQKNIRG